MKQNIFRTHHCSDIDASLVGQTITVSGWIENIRDVIPYPRTPGNCDY